MTYNVFSGTLNPAQSISQAYHHSWSYHHSWWYFTIPPRPTQPPTPEGQKMSTSQSVVMLCSWGVKADMAHSTWDKCVGFR